MKQPGFSILEKVYLLFILLVLLFGTSIRYLYLHALFVVLIKIHLFNVRFGDDMGDTNSPVFQERNEIGLSSKGKLAAPEKVDKKPQPVKQRMDQPEKLKKQQNCLNIS